MDDRQLYHAVVQRTSFGACDETSDRLKAIRIRDHRVIGSGRSMKGYQHSEDVDHSRLPVPEV